MNMKDLYEAVSQNKGALSSGTKSTQIKAFQTGIYNSLNKATAVNGYKWQMNSLCNQTKTPVCILGQKAGDVDWIIEIDVCKTVPVVQKMLSYLYLYNKPFHYVAILYPGTKSLDKYDFFHSGNYFAKAQNKDSSVSGIFIDPNDGYRIYLPQ